MYRGTRSGVFFNRIAYRAKQRKRIEIDKERKGKENRFSRYNESHSSRGERNERSSEDGEGGGRFSSLHDWFVTGWRKWACIVGPFVSGTLKNAVSFRFQAGSMSRHCTRVFLNHASFVGKFLPSVCARHLCIFIVHTQNLTNRE